MPLKRPAAACGRICFFMLLCAAGLWPWTTWAGAPADELRRKTADVTLLEQQLGDRILQAEQIRAQLMEQQRQLVDEINKLRKQHNVSGLIQADRIPRIHYNIELLRSIMAYTAVFDAKILHYQTGRDKMNYLLRLIEDDLKMIRAISDLKIDALTTQVSLIINRYLPDAHVIQIDPDAIDPLTAEAVWEAVLKGRLPV